MTLNDAITDKKSIPDKLLPESFHTRVGMSRVRMAHPDFYRMDGCPSCPHVPAPMTQAVGEDGGNEVRKLSE